MEEQMPKTFDCKNCDGQPIVIDTTSTDKLSAIVQSTSATAEQKSVSAELLAWAAERIEESSHLPALNQAAARVLVEYELYWVLKGRQQLVTKTVNGVTSKVLEPVEAVA